MNILPPLLAAALLLAPAIGLAAERTGIIDARGTRIELPIPDEYVQSSLDMPEWIELAKTLAPKGATVEDVLVHAECMSDPETLFCPPSYELLSMPLKVNEAEWRELRVQLIEALTGDTRAMQEMALKRAQDRLKAESTDAEFTRDTSSRVVLVRSDDPRSVRFYFNAPGRIEGNGVVVEQVRVAAQFAIQGQLMILAVSREVPEGEATPEVYAAVADELNRFMDRLLALNPE